MDVACLQRPRDWTPMGLEICECRNHIRGTGVPGSPLFDIAEIALKRAATGRWEIVPNQRVGSADRSP
jgi:hypothetical protein